MDGPGQGEVGFELGIRHDYEQAVSALLDALDDRDALDLPRIAAAGVSLGGYHALRSRRFRPARHDGAGQLRPVEPGRGAGAGAAPIPREIRLEGGLVGDGELVRSHGQTAPLVG
ncbi:hypothetical protein ABZ468_47135 [Streptomyces sp. NPDC005708]|uniref:hypothetical protein n=1 Tax=Streptomyces sp. NPDC005708 TaxID=3154564 RepID=UPI0033D71D23